MPRDRSKHASYRGSILCWFEFEMPGLGRNNTAMSLRSGKQLIFCILLGLVGCYQQPGAGQAPPADVLTFARQQLEAIRKGDVAEVESIWYPQVDAKKMRPIVQRAAAYFPVAEPKSLNLVAFLENKEKSGTDMAFEYAFPHGWILARVSIVRTNGVLLLGGFYVNHVTMPVGDLLAMHWSQHGLRDSLWLAAAIIEPVFILGVLVLCVRTPIPKRKWLWLIFIAFGWLQLTLDWHNGAWHANPLGFQLLGSGYLVPMKYPPLIWPLYLTISIPVGAILFLFKRKQFLTAKSIPSQSVAARTDEPDHDGKPKADEAL